MIEQTIWIADRSERRRLTDGDHKRLRQLIRDYVLKSKHPTTEMCAVYVMFHNVPMRRWYIEKGGPLYAYYQNMKTLKAEGTLAVYELPQIATDAEEKPYPVKTTPTVTTLDERQVAIIVRSILNLSTYQQKG